MNKKEVAKSYLQKSQENYDLYKFLSKEDKFIEWQAVSIFYSALCYVKAYLYSRPSMPPEAINSHRDIKTWLTLEANAKRLMIYEKYYNFLYDYSRDARYKCNKIYPRVIEKMIEKHNKIKELLTIDMCEVQE